MQSQDEARTEQEDAAFVLSANQELVPAVLDQMPAGVIVGEAPSGRLLFHNREATRILGHPLIHTSDLEGYREYGGVHEDGTPYEAADYPSARALAGETVHHEEVRYRRGDGSIIWLLVNSAPIRDTREGIMGTVTTFHDVTELRRAAQALRESEERFRAMADNLPLIVWMHDRDGAQEFVNATFCEFFGVTRQQMIENRWQILMHPEDSQAYTDAFIRAVREQASFQAEVRVKRADGEWRWIRSWAQPRFGFENEYLGHVGTSADITEQKAAEEVMRSHRDDLERRVEERTAALNRQASRLRELSGQLATAEHRERKRLASMLHDELQQYLVAAKFKLFQLRGFLITDDATSLFDDAVGMITDAIQSSRNLSHELRPPVLYEQGLIPALKWLAGEMGRRHEIRIHVDADAPEGKVLLDDDARAFVYTSTQELLFNTIKHAGVREARLAARVEDSRLTIEVVDHGAGLDLEAVKDKDTGMGLFTVGERISGLGGAMNIDSAPGKGTRITLQVPVAVTVPDVGTSEARRRTETGTAGMTFRSAAPAAVLRSSDEPGARDVLIVDDRVIARKGVASLLEEAHRAVRIREAADGREALRLMEEHLPDVVLLDVNLPGMNGYDVARRIREVWPTVRIVGISVQDDQATVQSLMDAGASAFVSKSDDAEQIRQTVFASD